MTSIPKTITPAEPRIWSSVIRGLLVPLTEQGIETTPLLERFGIDQRDLEKPHGEIALKKYLQLIEAAAAIAGDPVLGIKLARSAGPETLGAIGFLFLSSRTLSEALNNFCQYMNLLQDITHVQLTQNSKTITFSYELYDVDATACRQDVEFSIALTSRLIRIYGGPNVELRRVRFRHSALASLTEYQRLLKAPVEFDQDANSISIPAVCGQVRSTVLDHSLSRILQDFLDTELEKRNRFQSFADQVKQILIGGGVAPPITAAKIANCLGVSEATFYRRLKSEGKTFSELTDERNFEIAKSYLLESSLSITEIAYTIGFAESASFTRAFSRWSNGQKPSDFRKNLKSKRS